MADARDVVRDQALEIAASWSAPTAPLSWALTATMLRTIADEPAVLDLAAQIPLDKLPPLLLSAATRHLIGELRSDLARYFPSAGSSQPVLDAGFAPAFRDFCIDHSEELLALCQEHRYQMNEVARCTQLALALEVVRQHWPTRALALIDVGTGAGLALHLDRYRYRVGDAPAFGDPTSALEMRCELRGKLRPPHPEHLPAIAARVGVDRDPIDLTDAAARSWLESCVPPEADSITRFVSAASIATRDSVTLIAGDGADTLLRVLSDVRGDLLPVVIDAYTLVFFEDEHRARFRAALVAAGSERDLAWISLDPLVPLGLDGRRSVQELPVPARVIKENRREGVFALLGLLRWQDKVASSRLLGRAHPSGTWLEWLDAETAS